MDVKICTKCKRELPIDDFNWRDKKKGTRRSECKYCHTAYMNELYQNKRKIVEDLKTKKSCQKCGENRGYVLDFHHLDPSVKENTVARMISNNFRLDYTLQEIEKCIVLCSNCHREFHYLNDNSGVNIQDYLRN